MDPASEDKGAALADRNDKFSISYFIWVLLIGLLFAFGSDLDRIFNLWLMLVPIIFLPALVVAAFWLAALIRNLWLKRWKRVTSIVVAPIAVCLIFASARMAGISPEFLRFAIWKSHYIEQVEKLPPTDEPRLATFDWGQTGGAGVANFIYTLVFDESDEIARAPEQRSRAWQDRMNRRCPGTTPCSPSDPAGFSIAVRKLDGHFYLVTTSW
ncbi:hypothetical protein [Bradyrhizobium ivorense]|uniref:hypothetical protein n=1 Tax=Bradyrhizobium ivorense TaxID=2511166 RepID=UPI0010B16CCA|nr:hypothetical protein [Bradyrhizobium ivorense]VIO69028.1 hypothetical protein CI41S_16830 [Bradyrhizobium ivorense]